MHEVPDSLGHKPAQTINQQLTTVMNLKLTDYENGLTAAAVVGEVHMPLFAEVHSTSLTVLRPEYAHPEIPRQHLFSMLHCLLWRQSSSHWSGHWAPALHLLVQLSPLLNCGNTPHSG